MLLALLASSLPDPSSAESIGWLLLALAALVGAGNQAMGLLEKFRTARAPAPGEISEDRVKALESRVLDLEMKMENHLGRIAAKFESISTTLTNLQSDWNYAVGRIDGRSEASHEAHLQPPSQS